jgi:hypothetical protein
MTSVRTHSSRAARFIVTTLVATVACAVVAPNVTPVKAAGANIIDYFATTSSTQYFSATDNSTFDSMGDFTVEAWVKPDADVSLPANAQSLQKRCRGLWEFLAASCHSHLQTLLAETGHTRSRHFQ